MIVESYSDKDTIAVAKKMAESAKPGDIYCLSGDLGVGKTVFVKGFALGLNVNDDVTSPTFTLINEYEGDIKLFHFDAYRIESSSFLDDFLFEEYFYGDGVCLIEWAEYIKNIIPSEASWIYIEKDSCKGYDYRKIIFEV